MEDPGVGATTRLQEGLERAAHFKEQIKKDYDSITSAYTQLKEAHVQLLKAFQEQERQNSLLIQAKDSVERECALMYKQWGEQLKLQTEKMRHLESQILPSRELERVRLQMLNELERPHREQIEALAEELQSFRDMYHKEHRQLELFKTELQNVKEEYARESQSARQQSDSVLGELTLKNQKLQQLIESQGLDSIPVVSALSPFPSVGQAAAVNTPSMVGSVKVLDRWRQAERDLADSIVLQKQLVQEMEGLRTAKEQSVVSLEESRLVQRRAEKQHEARNTQLERENVALRRKNESLLEELSTSRDKLASSVSAFAKLQEETTQLQLRLKSTNDDLKLWQDRNGVAQVEARRLVADELARLQSELTAMRDAYREVSASRDELKQTMTNQEVELANQLTSAKDEFLKKLLTSEHSRSALEMQMADVEKQLMDKQKQYDHVLEGAHQELNDERELVRHQRDEMSALQARAEGLQSQMAQTKADLEIIGKSAKESELEYQTLQRKHREMMEQQHHNDVAKERLEAEKGMLMQELQTVSADRQKDSHVHAATLKTAQDAWLHERHALVQQFTELKKWKDHTEHNVSVHTLSVKKDKNRYKRMCIALKNRLGDATKEVATARRELAVQLQAKNFELRTVQRQLQEVESQRDDLKTRLLATPPESALSASAAVVPQLTTLFPSFHAFSDDIKVRQDINQLLARAHGVAVSATASRDDNVEVASHKLDSSAYASLSASTPLPSRVPQEIKIGI